MARFEIMRWTEELGGYRVVATATTWNEVHAYGKAHAGWDFFDMETGRIGNCAEVPAGIMDTWEV